MWSSLVWWIGVARSSKTAVMSLWHNGVEHAYVNCSTGNDPSGVVNRFYATKESITRIIEEIVGQPCDFVYFVKWGPTYRIEGMRGDVIRTVSPDEWIMLVALAARRLAQLVDGTWQARHNNTDPMCVGIVQMLQDERFDLKNVVDIIEIAMSGQAALAEDLHA